MASTEDFNRGVLKWAKNTKQKLQLNILRLTTTGTDYAHDHTDVKVRKFHGEASRIAFNHPYYMIFVHKGAGKGYGGSKTKLFTRADGTKGKTNPNSLGKMGTGKRKPKEWYNPIIEQEYPSLEAIILPYHGEKAINRLQKILIK